LITIKEKYKLMSITNFVGFYYIENDPNGFMDNAFGLREDISNVKGSGNSISFHDILSKFSKPLQLTRNNGIVSQKYIVENLSTDGTANDLTNLNTATNGWPEIFNIANYIYNNAAHKNAEELNDIFLGRTEDPNWNKVLFQGYLANTLTVIMRGDRPDRIDHFIFAHEPAPGLPVRYFTMYVNPESFYRSYTIASPYIYIWYTLNDVIERHRQYPMMNDIFKNIGRMYVNNYRTINIPVNMTGDSIEQVPFHIYTNSLTIPVDPVADPIFLQEIRNVIRNEEPELNDEQLMEKYPTVFTEECRIIIPLFDNLTLRNYQVQDPINGSPLMYMSNPVNLKTIQTTISTSQPFNYLDTFEIFTLAHQWVTFIVGGAGGALTDKIPKFRPLLEDIDSRTADDAIAKTFITYLDKILNYIMGRNQLTDLEKDTMGFIETTPYVSFKMRAAEWRVYKRGYKTQFDSIP
jgi:hypothetical protein